MIGEHIETNKRESRVRQAFILMAGQLRLDSKLASMWYNDFMLIYNFDSWASVLKLYSEIL